MADKKIQKQGDRLAFLKLRQEADKLEADQLQAEIIDHIKDQYPGTETLEAFGKITTEYGVLNLRKRTAVNVLDIPAVFKKVGKDRFMKICSVPAGKLKKLVGEIGFSKLEKLGLVKTDDPTYFYQLKKSDKGNVINLWEEIQM